MRQCLLSVCFVVFQEGGLDKEKISELAEKYAADLKTHVKDVTESLEEFYRIVTAPDEQSVSSTLFLSNYLRFIGLFNYPTA